MNSPHRRISATFIGIFVFVVVQVAWWNIFFARYTGKVTKSQKIQWTHDQTMMRALFQRHAPNQQKALLARCQKLYPHLRCRPPFFHIQPASLEKLYGEKHRVQRMFLFEGCFFFLFFVGGLFILWLGIHAERELKNRQQNFLSAVSHEMRTPISTMRLLLETLQLRNLSESKKEKYLSRLGKQMDRLQHTCEQVVAAAMLDGQSATQSLVKEELNAQVESILEMARPDLEDRGATITWTPATAPVEVSLDPRAISLVLMNLLENAVKYNAEADKQVHVRVEQEGAMARVIVEDNGPGIPIEERDNVFRPFYRVGQELTRQKDGLGLGLYLVRGLCEAMQGNVRYEALAQGSRFTLEWPIAKQV